jgi:hypothetical protein
MNLNFDSALRFLMNPSLAIGWVVLFWVATAIVHIGFAIAVLQDTRRRVGDTFLVGGGIWALATLLGGVVTAGIYWVIHHSTLRP